MRTTLRLTIATTLAALLTTPLLAQDRGYTIHVSPSQGPDPRQLPRDVASEVIRFYNAPGTLHFSGITRIPEARGIDGDVAVLGGPVTIAGRISGSLQVINGDLILEPGAVIGGDILVVGGDIEGQSRASIAGEVRSYRDVLRYRRNGDDLVYAPQRDAVNRWRRRHLDESSSSFTLSLGGTYNRVEGAPIVLGPTVNMRLGDNLRLNSDARLVLRTGENFSFQTGRFGYRAGTELVVGSRQSSVGFGVRAFDRIESTEGWPLRDFEAGWASFLLHADYRDWYRQQGLMFFTNIRPTTDVRLQLFATDQRELSADTNNPWTIFNSSRAWRTNPAIDEGRYRIYGASLHVDTRNDKSRPTSGMLVSADLESGNANHGAFNYQRFWLDARTYLRLTPTGRLNLRVAGGGKVGGDSLPLQRRVSLGFPDPLPGYRFRQLSCGGGALPGTPALCDRAIVAQAELRTHLGFDFGPDWANDWGDENGDDHWQPLHVSGPDVVVFADAGYAWSVGSGPGQIPSSRWPALGNWLPDVGLGLDLGPVGMYLAKSIGTQSRDDLTFTVRLGRRF